MFLGPGVWGRLVRLLTLALAARPAFFWSGPSGSSADDWAMASVAEVDLDPSASCHKDGIRCSGPQAWHSGLTPTHTTPQREVAAHQTPRRCKNGRSIAKSNFTANRGS